MRRAPPQRQRGAPTRDAQPRTTTTTTTLTTGAEEAKAPKQTRKSASEMTADEQREDAARQRAPTSHEGPPPRRGSARRKREEKDPARTWRRPTNRRNARRTRHNATIAAAEGAQAPSDNGTARSTTSRGAGANGARGNPPPLQRLGLAAARGKKKRARATCAAAKAQPRARGTLSRDKGETRSMRTRSRWWSKRPHAGLPSQHHREVASAPSPRPRGRVNPRRRAIRDAARTNPNPPGFVCAQPPRAHAKRAMQHSKRSLEAGEGKRVGGRECGRRGTRAGSSERKKRAGRGALRHRPESDRRRAVLEDLVRIQVGFGVLDHQVGHIRLLPAKERRTLARMRLPASRGAPPRPSPCAADPFPAHRFFFSRPHAHPGSASRQARKFFQAGRILPENSSVYSDCAMRGGRKKR